jgi:hypothetical protein
MISENGYQKSTFSGGGGCVEVCRLANGNISLRDSKNRSKPAHEYTPAEWTAFLAGVRNAEFDLEP